MHLVEASKNILFFSSTQFMIHLLKHVDHLAEQVDYKDCFE